MGAAVTRQQGDTSQSDTLEGEACMKPVGLREAMSSICLTEAWAWTVELEADEAERTGRSISESSPIASTSG